MGSSNKHRAGKQDKSVFLSKLADPWQSSSIPNLFLNYFFLSPTDLYILKSEKQTNKKKPNLHLQLQICLNIYSRDSHPSTFHYFPDPFHCLASPLPLWILLLHPVTTKLI